VAELNDVPPGSSKRIYLGTDAIALFNVGGTFYACSDRCTHGRASLSEGTVDTATCVLTCPWHGGQFDLKTGKPSGGPPVIPVKTYRVKVEGARILVG
jgi:nitrite reductase/ring-hydroxylating ferredoxin subunit